MEMGEKQRIEMTVEQFEGIILNAREMQTITGCSYDDFTKYLMNKINDFFNEESLIGEIILPELLENGEESEV